MASRKYPPQGDAEIIAAGQVMSAGLTTPADYSLTAADATRVSTATSEAEAAFGTNQTAQSAARTARIAKDEKIDALEAVLSEINRRVQPLSTVSDSQRREIGLPIYDKTATSADAPTVLPVVKIDAAMPLRHEIGFSGEGMRGKPEGVKAVEIYIKIGGDATGNVGDYQFLAQDSEPPYTKDFAAADASKQAHYLFCWVNASGERGAFQMASATVTSLLQTDNSD
jgi:hypothetical protein